MANIAAANVSYSFTSRDRVPMGRRGYSSRGTISFGNGSLLYASGGVPLTKGKMGMPRVLRTVDVLESNAQGYLFEHDVSAEKIRIFYSPTAAVTGNVAAPKVNFASAAGNVAADKVVGLNALSNNTALVANTAITGVTGVQAPAFTGDNVAAAAFNELTAGTTVVPTVVLEVIAEGY